MMTDEQFLQALYTGLLGRAPDPGGLQHHLQALQLQQADPLRYGRLAEAFTRGAEFQLRAELRLAPAGSNAYLPDFSGETFGHVVPLGSFCHAAMALKRLGLRQWAGPFDWIFSSVGMAAHCLEDDFATFLDAGQWRSVPEAERHTIEANRCDHRFYREQLGVPFVFNHHDPAADPAHAAYFQRAVQRLRQVLASPAWKLFVLVSPVPVSLEGLQPLLSALQRRSSNFVVLALQFKTVAPSAQPLALAQALRTRRLRHDLLAAELDVAQPSNGVVFPQARDNQMLDRFLRTFRIQPSPLQPL